MSEEASMVKNTSSPIKSDLPNPQSNNGSEVDFNQIELQVSDRGDVERPSNLRLINSA